MTRIGFSFISSVPTEVVVRRVWSYWKVSRPTLKTSDIVLPFQTRPFLIATSGTFSGTDSTQIHFRSGLALLSPLSSSHCPPPFVMPIHNPFREHIAIRFVRGSDRDYLPFFHQIKGVVDRNYLSFLVPDDHNEIRQLSPKGEPCTAVRSNHPSGDKSVRQIFSISRHDLSTRLLVAVL